MKSMNILPQDFYFDDTTTVARNLLGKILCVRQEDGEILRSRIVETEAYLGITDPACHTYNDRRTERTSAMYLDGGHSYVYMIYGMYYCLNFVTRTTKEPEAVLLRAVEPLPAQDHTKIKRKDLKTNGPGKLCRHYEIDKTHNGLKLWKKNSSLFVAEDDFKVTSRHIHSTQRIGVDYAGEAAEWPLRFYLKDNPFVSKK